MDTRHKVFFVHEAGAVHRQEMGRLAQAVAAGFNNKKGFNDFIAKLELYESRETIKKDDTLITKTLSLLRRRR